MTAMNRLKQEIRESMYDLVQNADGTITAGFLFTGSFIGFRGHFPEQPVLPGVCQVQAAVLMLELIYKAPVSLRAINAVKFYQPAGQEQALVVSLTQAPLKDALRVKGTIKREGVAIARIDITVTIGAGNAA